jgi:hypothetical protein
MAGRHLVQRPSRLRRSTYVRPDVVDPSVLVAEPDDIVEPAPVDLPRTLADAPPPTA